MPFVFNPFTGNFDNVRNSGGTENFSYTFIEDNKVLNIPLYQQMIVFQNITINGTLNLIGDLVLDN